MEHECEMCGCTDAGEYWHDLCFHCVGKLKAEREGMVPVPTGLLEMWANAAEHHRAHQTAKDMRAMLAAHQQDNGEGDDR